MAQPAPPRLDIVILGASFAGLAVAHAFLDNVINKVSHDSASPSYRIVIVSPSTHFFYNVCVPLALVEPGAMDPDLAFHPFEPYMRRYPRNQWVFRHGYATCIDEATRNVTVQLFRAPHPSMTISTQLPLLTGPNFNPQFSILVPYHALVIATGSSAKSPLFKIQGPVQHDNTYNQIVAFIETLRNVSSITIFGGGPTGCETAGQIAQWIHKQGQQHAKTVTIYSGSTRLLPRLDRKISAKAEKLLRDLGVNVFHDIRFLSSAPQPNTRKYICTLSDGTALITDLFIDATGLIPNTSFLPNHLLNVNNKVRNDFTLGVFNPSVGKRVYAIGDCANYSSNNLQDIFNAVPVLMHNLRNELLEYEYELRRPHPPQGQAAPVNPLTTNHVDARIAALVNKVYRSSLRSRCLVPITKFGGVGERNKKSVPGKYVYARKGKDWGLKTAKSVAERGVLTGGVKGESLGRLMGAVKGVRLGKLIPWRE